MLKSGSTIRDVSEILEIPVGTIKGWSHRANA
jgi:DNA-directed RNA polymerase specialized sigma24 family protein